MIETSGLINKTETKISVFKEGIRFKDIELDNFVPNDEIFSIRSISLFKLEIIGYCIVSILGFTLWWVVGVIISLYTIAQIYLSYRVLLITNKGNIPIAFKTFGERDIFLNALKESNPNIFKISRRFKFTKKEK